MKRNPVLLITLIFGIIAFCGAFNCLQTYAVGEGDLKQYYLNGDVLRFDFETMKGVVNSPASDIYFRYMRNSITVENGAVIKDLGIVDYLRAKAPASGYTTSDIAIVKDHVYAIRSGSKGSYMIKVTNYISETEMEFTARTAEAETASLSTPSSAVTNPTQQPAAENIAPTPAAGNVNQAQARKEDLYWVENGTRFVMGGKIIYEDAKGILEPFLSPDKKYVVYSNGSYDLLIYDITSKTIKRIYELQGLDTQINYRVYPVGWSQDSKQVAFMTSNRKGYIGHNQLCILNLSDKKVSVVAQCLSSADWGRNGMFAIADGTEAWLVDQLGRNKIILKVPTVNAFYGADYVSFTADCSKVIYAVGSKYYLHDIKANTYEELSIPGSANSNDTVRAGANGKIAIVQNRKIYVYDIASKGYSLLYEGADSAYANWIEGTNNTMKLDLLGFSFHGTAYLCWDVKNLEDIDGYYIYRAAEPGKYSVPLTSSPIFKMEFTDEKVQVGMRYYYIVRALYPGNKLGEPSNEVSVTITDK